MLYTCSGVLRYYINYCNDVVWGLRKLCIMPQTVVYSITIVSCHAPKKLSLDKNYNLNTWFYSWIYLSYSGCCWPSYKTLINWHMICQRRWSNILLFSFSDKIIHSYWQHSGFTNLGIRSFSWHKFPTFGAIIMSKEKIEWNSWAYVGTIRAPEGRCGLYVYLHHTYIPYKLSLYFAYVTIAVLVAQHS